MDALGRITGVVNELGSFTTSTAAQKRAAADGTVLVNDYGSGEKQGTDSLVYLSDHLGSARAWYRVSDGQVGLAEYGAFGQRQLLAAGPGEPERGYTGHLRHAASGLVLAPYRAYDPQLARWLSEDPIMEAGGLNLYGYVGNGPVMAADPLGLIEGSQNNLAKRAVIDKIARSYNGSQLWNYGVPKGPMGANSYKCSQFVFDVAREAGARLPLIGGGFPLAGALPDPNRNLKKLAPFEAWRDSDGGRHCGVSDFRVFGSYWAYRIHYQRWLWRNNKHKFS